MTEPVQFQDTLVTCRPLSWASTCWRRCMQDTCARNHHKDISSNLTQLAITTIYYEIISIFFSQFRVYCSQFQLFLRIVRLELREKKSRFVRYNLNSYFFHVIVSLYLKILTLFWVYNLQFGLYNSKLLFFLTIMSLYLSSDFVTSHCEFISDHLNFISHKNLTLFFIRIVKKMREKSKNCEIIQR